MPIVLAQEKAENTSENLLYEIRKKFCILCVTEKNYWNSSKQYNEFNKVTKQNGYHNFEFWE